jgi:hypothetical protein
LISVFAFGKRVTKQIAIALVLTYAGIAFVFWHDFGTFGENAWIGGGLILLSAITYAFYLAIGGRLIGRLGSMRFTTLALLVSGTTQTPNVTLGVYRVKSQNVSSTINNMSFNIKTSTGVATGTLFSNVRLETGSLSYGANSLTGGSTFTNLQIPLPQDQWVELTLKADVAGADTSSGVAASSTMVAASISGIDANFNSLTVSNGGNVTSSDVTFLQSGVGISNTSASIGTCNPAVANGPNVSCLATFTFTLQNTGNNVVYVSKTPGVTFATSTTPASVASSTITVLNASSPSDDSADTTASFAIQSGASRTFTGLGSPTKPAGTCTVTGSRSLPS